MHGIISCNAVFSKGGRRYDAHVERQPMAGKGSLALLFVIEALELDSFNMRKT